MVPPVKRHMVQPDRTLLISFESKIDKKSKWSTPVPVEVINSEFEDGTPSFSSDL